MMGIKLVKLCQDGMSGGKDVRPGLADALRTLQGSADVLIVLKFDRLSRSIKHFCELYETYFKDGTKELVAIRESIRLESSLGRAKRRSRNQFEGYYASQKTPFVEAEL